MHCLIGKMSQYLEDYEILLTSLSGVGSNCEWGVSECVGCGVWGKCVSGCVCEGVCV